MAVKAVIVGIEKYRDETLNVRSPVLNAVAVARWALDAGVPANDIFLFVSPLDPDVTRTLEQDGVRIRDATLEVIDTALRTELPGVEAGSGLLFYWCGHGMADTAGQRVLICADYAPNLANRVFNATLFFRKLRSDTYEGYRRQLVLADVCGTQSQMSIEPDNTPPGPVFKRDQLIYFATPEGGFAKAVTGEGAFTHCALKALKSFGGFPDFTAFKGRLEHELQLSGLPRFLVEGRSETHAWEIRYGRGAETADEALDGLIEKLVKHTIPHKTAKTQFQATVSALGNPRLLAAEGLTGMVRELSALRDVNMRVPYGLVQFLLRLAEAMPEHAPMLKAWLDIWADSDLVEREQERLRDELHRNLLIIDVVPSQDGGIRELRPQLRSLDQSEMRGPPLDPIPIRTWAEVETGMLGLLTLLQRLEFTDLEIHFVVEVSVFERPFHHIPGPGGSPLGEDFGVVLHHRERVLPASTPSKRAFAKRFEAIRHLEPATLSWFRCHPERALPVSPVLCLAERPPMGTGQIVLAKLLKLGAPGIYWPHAEDEADAELSLTDLVRQLASLAGMPDAMRSKRISDLKPTGSLLWDAMIFKPYGG